MQNPALIILKFLHLYCNLLGERLADAGVGSQTAHLTGHALDALLGLEDGAVHVLHPPHHVGQRARVCRGRMLILETHAVVLTI